MKISSKHPILYSFRRCPYAMRARLAIESSGVKIELREVLLRDKPSQLLKLSGKATVPVLLLPSGQVFDESLDIMLWALSQNDPQNLIRTEQKNISDRLIELNDFQFKPQLDKYKYAVRFPEKTEREYRSDCEWFLTELNEKLQRQKYLVGDNLSLADFAIFPFVRQFSSVDRHWFNATRFEHLKQWLESLITSASFIRVMEKYEPWEKDQVAIFVYE